MEACGDPNCGTDGPSHEKVFSWKPIAAKKGIERRTCRSVGRIGRREKAAFDASFLIVFAVILFLAPPVCRAANASSRLKIGGTGAILETMRTIAAEYRKTKPYARIEVLPSLGSGGGIRAVRAGVIEIGLSSRPLSQSEHTPELEARAFARTPFVFIADPRCDCDPVTPPLLLSLLSGRVHNWSSGERVRLILRPPKDSDTLLIKSLSGELGAAMDRALQNDGLVSARTDQDSADAVETIPGALGFSTLALVRSEKRRVKVLPYRSVEPTLENLESGTYALSKTFFLVLRKDAGEAARDFVDFVFSGTGSATLRQSGSLPLAGMEGEN